LAFTFGVIIVATVVALAVSGSQATRSVPKRKTPASATIERGRALLQRGKPEQALAAVRSIQAGESDEADALVIRGLSYAALNEVAAARNTLERAWRLRPDPMAAKVLAAIYAGSNETQRATDALNAAAKLDPADFRPWYALGAVIYAPHGRHDDAVKAFREALSRLPKHDESRIGLIDSLLATYKAEQAAPLLDALRQERPDDPKVLALAARLARDTGNEKDAARLAQEALAHDPDNREALILRAKMTRKGVQADQALRDIERAVSLDSNDAQALRLLASIEAAHGLKARSDATLSRCERVVSNQKRIDELTAEIEAHPNDPALRCGLARAAMDAHLTPLAIQSYQAALAIDPNYSDAKHGLARLNGSPIEASPSAASRHAGKPERSAR
jgi:Tfp pilus assembly protein PilF